MTLRRRICTIGGTAIYLHLGTVLFALYMVLLGKADTLVMSFLSILLHETAHGVAAHLLGQTPREMEMTPLGALLRLEDEEALSFGKRLMMLAAGPGASLILCWAALWGTRWGLMGMNAGRKLFCCNLLLVLGNLLPALPLDGGRILALLLGRRCRSETVRKLMRITGTALGMACIAANLLLSVKFGGWNLSCAMAGCFLMYSAAVGTTNYALAELRAFVDKKIRLETKRMLNVQWLTLAADMPLCRCIACLQPDRYAMLILVDAADMKVLGQADEGELMEAYVAHPSESCRTLLGQTG